MSRSLAGKERLVIHVNNLIREHPLHQAFEYFFSICVIPKRPCTREREIYLQCICIDVSFTDECNNHPILTCENGGYQDPNDCSKCRCPEGLGGTLCDEAAPGVSGETFIYCSVFLSCMTFGCFSFMTN